MPFVVTSTAQIKCSFGLAPAVLNATPTGVQAGKLPAATTTCIAPTVNIPPFGMCTTQSNPAVAAATAAALGTPTPAPCVPVPAGPWAPGSAVVKIHEMPALTNTSTCECTWGGVITIVNAGQEIVQAN